jgi:hypothetical protein
MPATKATHCSNRNFNILKKTARIVSVIFHPMFMPLLTLWIIFNYNPYVTFNIPRQLHLLIFGIVGVYTLLIPFLSSVILKKMNLISNYEMNDRNERKLPFLIAGFSFFFCYYMLQKYPALIIISLIMLGATIAMLATLILNYKFKISAHMIGIGGLIGSIAGLTILLGVDYRALIIVALIIAGIVGSSRLYLGAHAPYQIYWGFLIGFLSEFCLLVFI